VKEEKEKSQANQQTLSAALSFGASILSAMFSRKLTSAGNISKVATAARQSGRAYQERQDISDAAESKQTLVERLAELDAEIAAETTKVQDGLQPDALTLEALQIAPKKSEINVSGVTLVWQPWIARMDGTVEEGG